jgi:hypothetical protein
VPAAPALTVAAVPVVVPPEAPVDVTVRSRALAGREVEVLVGTGAQWRVEGRVVLDQRGRGTVRVSRRPAATYTVRAVALLRGGVAASAEGSFRVTATGDGDPRAYRFLYVSRGAPARWNPCAVVTYRVNAATAAPTSRDDLREALRRVTYETGVRFRYLGETRYVPGARGFRYEADLVVAWSEPRMSRELGGDRAAAGGFTQPVAGRGGRPRIRNAFVVVDATRGLPGGFGEGETEGQVLLHELGHAMGLGHVEADAQIMRPELHDMKAALYGAGDLTALRRLGRRAGCL